METTADVMRFLEQERERVDREMIAIAESSRFGSKGALRESIEYALATRGKRLRPILCVAAYRVASGVPAVAAPAYRLACAIEIVHTYSLVHDDLPCMDDDDLRRGRPTVHTIHGVQNATLAGAALLPLSVQVLEDAALELELPAATRARLVTELCAAAGAEGMVGGQLLDLEGEAGDVDAAGLEAIHRAKTGALLVASLRLGGIAAGATPEILESLTRYGRALGLAFQIADDILDVTGDSAELGKTAGRDQSLQKASYPAFFGVEGARKMARARADEAREALAAVSSPELDVIAEYVITRSA